MWPLLLVLPPKSTYDNNPLSSCFKPEDGLTIAEVGVTASSGAEAAKAGAGLVLVDCANPGRDKKVKNAKMILILRIKDSFPGHDRRMFRDHRSAHG
jgi:hypothetical protein